MNVTRSSTNPLTIEYTAVGTVKTSSLPNSLANLPMGAFMIGVPATNHEYTKNDWGYSIAFADVSWKVMVMPAEYQVGLQDIDLEAGRTATGIMVRHKKAVKRALSIKTTPLTSSEISSILKAIDPRTEPTSTSTSESTAAGLRTRFAVAYHDPWEGGALVKVF